MKNIFLRQNSSLIKNHNLLENPLLFPTEITNLLFVIKNRQPLKQNFMLNCKKTNYNYLGEDILFWRFLFQIKTKAFWASHLFPSKL